MKLKLTDNLFLKILSVGIAVLIWLVVMNINDAEKTKVFSKSVKLINTDVITENGKVFRVVEGTDYVNVRVRTRKSVIDELSADDFIVTADMQKDLKLNNTMVGISVECKNRNVKVDEHVTLSRSNVEVSIEDSATEQFQVHVRKVGTENDGLVVGSLIPEQTIIKITGPISLVQRIKTVEAPVDVTGIPVTSVRTCELKLYDGLGGEIDNTYLNYVGKADGINVTVSMLNTKTVPLKFSYSGTPAENYIVKDVSYKPETIEIAGTVSVLSGISRWEVPAEAVNVDGIDDELQLVVDLTEYLPPGVVLKDEEASTVLVIVEVEYVEPEEESEEEEDNSDASADEDTKPDTPSKPQKPTEETDKQPASPETDSPGTGADSENTGNGTETDSETGSKNNSNNEAGSENNDKTKGNS